MGTIHDVSMKMMLVYPVALYLVIAIRITKYDCVKYTAVHFHLTSYVNKNEND